MDPAVISWIIKLVSGAVGGNVAGAAMKDKSLGVLGNSLAGILGGGVGGLIMQLVGAAQAGGLDMSAVVSSVASGGIGGAVMLILAAIVKGAMVKNS
jgi:uncharacterized membrane protein YeaQ/YmgE (transglycosylase-associated protein family)